MVELNIFTTRYKHFINALTKTFIKMTSMEIAQLDLDANNGTKYRIEALSPKYIGPRSFVMKFLKNDVDIVTRTVTSNFECPMHGSGPIVVRFTNDDVNNPKMRFYRLP
jgi:hypothetical protein